MTDIGAKPQFKEIRVLVAEDSATVRYHLTGMINNTPGMRVVGEARNGEEVLALLPQLKPDVVSMDINMPRMDGLEATRRIMAEFPTPVVVVSGLVEHDVDLSFQALQAGALAVVEKPPDRSSAEFFEKHRQFVKTLMAMSDVKVIRRGIPARNNGLASEGQTVYHPPTAPELLVIGASAGGPSALSVLLKGLPSSISIPVVIGQHIPNEFVGGLARWLSKTTDWAVEVVTDDFALQPGMVHISPGNAHLTITRRNRALVTKLISEQGLHRHQPSIDVLLESVATTCGAAAIGVILTGMGDDGAAGLLAMREAGARTFAQDKGSSTVFGMPNAAVERGGVEHVVALANLSAAIAKLL